MTKEEKFLGLYNDLDDALRERYHCSDRTQSVLIRFMSELNKTGINEYAVVAKKLNMVRIIRNNLIHELDMNQYDLVEITDETIDLLQKVLKALANPKTAKDIATPIDKAFAVRVGDKLTITETIDIMREKGYTQVPVLDKSNKLLGVFSPNVLFNYLSRNKEKCINSIKIEDIAECLDIKKHFSETYIFVREDTDEEDIDEMFMSDLALNKKPVMVFVTSDGTSKGIVAGIIVLKDLIDSTKKIV